VSEAFWNAVRKASSEAGSSRAVTRHGTIQSYDPDAYAVKAMLQPDGTLTGWIPLKAVWAGNGWGAFFAPAIGTAVEVDFQEADGGVGSAGLSFFNDVERPLSVPAGEFWLVHEKGASIKLTNDGALALADGQGATIAMPGDGTIQSAGNWAHTGTFSANGIGLTTHHHTLVQPGSGNSGGPAA
jgi:phage baseplate assembly protein gpV